MKMRWLEEKGVTMEILSVEHDCKNEAWGEKFLSVKRDKYNVRITRGMNSFTIDFWQSVVNSEKGIQPELIEVLACMNRTEFNSVEDFCAEMGYNKFSEYQYDTVKIYRACMREYGLLRRMFGDCWDDFCDVVSEY